MNISTIRLILAISVCVALTVPSYACERSGDGSHENKAKAVSEAGAVSQVVYPVHINKSSKKQANMHQIAKVRKASVVSPSTGNKTKQETSLAGKKSTVERTGVDIKTLEKRLKSTDAIGFFTKLAIRNDIVDLMDKIKKYRKSSLLKSKMKEIRSSFDGLLLKIIALLRDDPKLSRDLYVGRESIWESLLEVKA